MLLHWPLKVDHSKSVGCLIRYSNQASEAMSAFRSNIKKSNKNATINIGLVRLFHQLFPKAGCAAAKYQFIKTGVQNYWFYTYSFFLTLDPLLKCSQSRFFTAAIALLDAHLNWMKLFHFPNPVEDHSFFQQVA